jgi:ATP-dependent RNA helicase DHX29
LLTKDRDASVKVKYTAISEVSFACRHEVTIIWTKPQEIQEPVEDPSIRVTIDPTRFTLQMVGIATPDAKQSEAFAATSALFHIFSSNSKEEKVGLRLPPAWKDLWQELSESKKSHAFAQDRAVVKDLRTLVQQRQDQELEDGVILQGAFKGRGAAKATQETNDTRSQSKLNGASADVYKKIWFDKSNTPKYQQMLVRRHVARHLLPANSVFSNSERSCRCGTSGSKSCLLWTRIKWSSSAVRLDGEYDRYCAIHI